MRNKYIIACLLVLSFLMRAEGNAPCGSRIKYVVFDFGGTIANDDTSQLVNYLMNSFPISIQESHMVLGKWRTDQLAGGDDLKFWENYGNSVGVKLPQDWLAQFEEVQACALIPIQQTINVIYSLRAQGYPLGMLSNVTKEHAEIIRRLGYYNLFNPVLLSYAIGVEKPNLEAYKILLSNLPGIKPEEILFVDDQNRNVIAARELGINAIHLTNPQYLYDQFREFGICIDIGNVAQVP